MSLAITPPSGYRVWRAAATFAAVVFALAAPWTIAGSQTALGLALLVVLVGILSRRLSFPAPPWTFAAIVLLLAIMALSIPLGIDPEKSLRFFPGYAWVFLLPFLYWGLLADPRVRDRSLRALAISGALAGYYGLAQHFTTAVWESDTTPFQLASGGYIAVGTLGHHLTYAGVLLPVFFLALGLVLDSRRWFWLPVLLGVGLGLVFSFARSAWIGLAAGLLILGFLRGRRQFLLITGALLVGLAVLLVASPVFRERLVSLLSLGDTPRMRLWHTSLLIARDYPWMGAGVGSFGTLFPIYRVPGYYMATMHPHSDPLNILVETGILGLLAWLTVWAVFFRETGQSRQGPRVWLPDALRAGMGAMLIAGLGQCYVADEEVAQVWLFLATAALVLVRHLKTDAVRAAPPAQGKVA